MTSRTTTGLITPPYQTTRMDHYTASSKSNALISDLCAQTVCFLWFESLPTLHEAATSNYPHHTRIPEVDNMAKPEFVKWTKDVLSTTQVSTNVVILAMLFIYRLKIANPNVKGKAGSEYRLLTVALMLGNKFLDDNTYTNKTWADVTSIAVKEIHLMEVEFLSNMRYQLMVTTEEWQQWLIKINLFVRYQQKQQAMSLAHVSPRGLPSPPSLYDYAPSVGYVNHNQRQYTSQQNLYQPDPRGRKRSLGDAQFSDIHSMLPPYKRIQSQPSTPQRSTPVRLDQRTTHDVSPSKRAAPPTSVGRHAPVMHKFSAFPLNLPVPAAQSQHSGQSSNLSPSYLHAGAMASSGSSPTTSSISQYSNHSHGQALGYSPASLALQHRNSPYAPVQPVQRLVGKYQPIFNPSHLNSLGKQSLWYSQLAAGPQQPVYNAKVPLSAHGSPHCSYTFPYH